jgi:hypothetical protein
MIKFKTFQMSLLLVLLMFNITVSGCRTKIDKENLVQSIPNANQIDHAYQEIIKNIGLKEPLLSSFSVFFDRAQTTKELNSSRVILAVQTKENSFLNYEYNFPSGEVTTGNTSTLMNLNPGIEFDPKEYKSYLFKRKEMISFSKIDSLYKESLAQSGLDLDKAYITGITFSKKSYKLLGSDFSFITGVISVTNSNENPNQILFDFDESGKLVKRDK